MMIRLGALALVVAAIVLLVTNPNHEAHKRVVYTSVAAETTNSQTLGNVAASLLGRADILPLQYNNYLFFSTTTLQGQTRSVGFLSRVWKWK